MKSELTNDNKHSKGIYAIGDLKTCKVIYIGSTTDHFARRFRDHRSYLARNAHTNRHLQFVFNKRADKLRFVVLEEMNDTCDTNIRIAEAQWIHLKGFDKLVNLSTTTTHSTFSKDGVEKMRRIMKERWKDPEYKKKMVEVAKRVGKQEAKKTAKTYWFLNPLGELAKIHNLTQFCKNNGLRQSSMINVYSGKTPSHYGWRRYDYVPPKHDPSAKTYQFLNPQGKEVTVTNLKKFCRESMIPSAGMYALASGHKHEHHGWRLLGALGPLTEDD